MNDTIQALFNRKSVRSFEELEISETDRDLILDAALQAPTAGNQILYTILDIRDQKKKDALAISCDDQSFIGKAPMVLIFLADCRRWLDCYDYARVESRTPGMGDIILACEDALIAAQNTVVAAESLGIGSCYIGDILENYETHVKLLNLDKYVLPVTMLVFGYPTEQQKNRPKPLRFDKKYIVQQDSYSRIPEKDLREMFAQVKPNEDFDQYITAFCQRKYTSDFALEMTRSVNKYLDNFKS